MFKYFDYFLPKDITFYNHYPLHETKNSYEFEAFAFAADTERGYAVISNPDIGRINDINSIIQEEFDAEITGWLVLLGQQSNEHKAMIAQPTHSDLKKITYYDNHMPVWIVEIKPNLKSRLLA
jgi:hypothetical protein